MERFTAPERGILLALATAWAVAAAALVDLRFDGDWSNGVRLAIDAAVSALAFGLGARGGRPAEPDSAMLLAGLVTLTLALGHLAQVLGADEQIGGDLVWIGPVVAVLAAAIAVFFRAPAAALVAALATAAGVFAFVAVVVEPDDEETYRWVATGLIAGFLAAGLVLRALGDGRHSVQLVNAAGLMVIALSYALGVFLLVDFDDGYGLERGWEAVLVLGSLAVTACAVLFRERGTGWIGAVGLAAAIFSVAGESDETPAFVGWPLFLTVGAAVLFLAALLRPAARR